MRKILEKILVEIEKEAVTNKGIGSLQCEGMARAMDIIYSHLQDVKETDWKPVSEGYPAMEVLSETKDEIICKTDKVLIQTRQGDVYSAYCRCLKSKNDSAKDEAEWFTFGTGGRKMKVRGKVIAWKPILLYGGE